MKKLALALAVVVLAPLAARADDTKLPFNPYEKCEKGDWVVLTGTLRAKGSAEKTACAVYARVLKVEGDDVLVHEQAQVGAIEKSSKTFSKKEAPTIEAYFDLKE